MILLKIFFHLQSIQKKFFYKILYRNKIHWGKHTTFRKRFSLLISKNGIVSIGDNCFFNNDCSINCLTGISIGDNSIFGENVKIYDHNHGHNISSGVPFANQDYLCSPVIIGSNCWIGSNVVILKGVEIADNVVIGAGCVIYKNVSSGSIVVCNSMEIK